MMLRRQLSKGLKQLLVLVVGLLLLSAQAEAQNDPRMVVEITADEQGKLPAVQDATQQALPLLWDRLVEDSARSSLSDSMKATPFLLRVVPHSDRIEVIFNEERVLQYLDQQQIAYLKEPLHLHVQIEMVDSSDNGMPKTVEALQAHAQQVAAARGIVLDTGAPLLQAKWRWLDASQVYLTVQGTSLLTGFSETRSLQPGEPLEQLQAWIESLLLKARETYVTGVTTPLEQPVTGLQQDGSLQLMLRVEQAATLPAQVIFEDALRQNSHVKLIVPTFLGANSRQYRVVLNNADDTWLTDWFRQRGMRASPTSDGWLVQ